MASSLSSVTGTSLRPALSAAMLYRTGDLIGLSAPHQRRMPVANQRQKHLPHYAGDTEASPVLVGRAGALASRWPALMTSLIFIMLFVARVIDRNARLRDLAMSTDCQRTERDAHGTPRMSQEMRHSLTRKDRLK
jgi:hypothetical protein